MGGYTHMHRLGVLKRIPKALCKNWSMKGKSASDFRNCKSTVQQPHNKCFLHELTVTGHKMLANLCELLSPVNLHPSLFNRVYWVFIPMVPHSSTKSTFIYLVSTKWGSSLLPTPLPVSKSSLQFKLNKNHGLWITNRCFYTRLLECIQYQNFREWDGENKLIRNLLQISFLLVPLFPM